MTDKTPHTFIIAEAGVNHNGSPDLALRLIDAAAEAGADAVKFQTFRADQLVTRSAPKAAYQARETGAGESQYDMLRRLELDDATHHHLADACRDRGIEFLSTAFDEDSVGMLADLGVRRMKVPSGEITNGPLLLRMARTGLPAIVSTGMATMAEITDALAVFSWGFRFDRDPTSLAEIRASFDSPEGRAALVGRMTVLQCSTAYPAPPESLNLRVMDNLAETFGLPVGYSDHSVGIHIPVAAVARGACLIEKHFTLDRGLPGPDHKASLEPTELKAMAAAIRDVEQALGDGHKAPAEAEKANMAVARRGLIAAHDIRAGERLDGAALLARRPAAGASPMLYWDLLGKAAKFDIAGSAVINVDDLEEPS